ncbi:Uncharacterised protein [Mycobacterium tuberculosis]|uniref:Uncharacterized protein n=1 Tax=Mycobacterium tuberculosis TaxID=1773 RepID=A0A0U0TAJ5_MYCTX|nr:Uncharacterised protein [Mycobacterium tuberculosis]COZ01151.1 Uncharacterised protein [Mycobacterium tuberculosis]
MAPIAATRPAWASLVTSATPDRPRATRSRKNASQPAPSSAEVTWMPRISR